jgi:hypothetical protein
MSRLKLIREELKEFGSNVTIQGVRYVTDPQQGPML